MLSVVVNFFNNRREAQNTLHSLSRGYQLAVGDIPYEVIAVDNGSSQPLSRDEVLTFGPEFRYRYVQTSSASPAAAINAACREAAGDQLLVIIDGAHIVSPGVFKLASDAFSIFPSPFLATVSFHLSPKSQNESVLEGYDQQVEDRLLLQSGWKENGYRLFTVAGAFSDDSLGWFGCLFESGCYGIRKADYLSMGGLDERFQSRGGGLVSPDFFQSALARQDLQYVMLLGQGTFHQFHGGVASNVPMTQHPWEEFHREYVRIRGRQFERVLRRPFFMGALPKEALHIASASAKVGIDHWQKVRQSMNLFGAVSPDFRVRAQLLCEQAWQQFSGGDRMAALEACREALSLDRDCVTAHKLLAAIALAGMDYLSMLRGIHQHLQPHTYLEIGVGKGASIALASKNTLAIGVDPAPEIVGELSASVRIFRETSDEFFARHHLVEALGGKALDLAFIDGKHHFEYALRDFINVERNSTPATTVLIHDCYPLDEITAAREQVTSFWSGDVWKLIVCLKKYRPDLAIHTLAVPWTGLGVVRGLDRKSTVLSAQLDRLYAEFISMPYSILAVNKCATLNLVPGDWSSARKLLM